MHFPGLVKVPNCETLKNVFILNKWCLRGHVYHTFWPSSSVTFELLTLINPKKKCVCAGIETVGKNVLVAGRSKNVGMPIAMLLHTDRNHERSGGKFVCVCVLQVTQHRTSTGLFIFLFVVQFWLPSNMLDARWKIFFSKDVTKTSRFHLPIRAAQPAGRDQAAKKKTGTV